MDLQECDSLLGGRRVIRVMQLLGLWRYEGAIKKYYTIYSLMLHFTTTIPYTIMMCVDAFHSSDLEKLSNNLYMTLTKLTMLAKLANVCYNGHLLVDFFEALTKDALFQLQSAEERQYWARKQKHYGWIALLYFTMSIGGVSIAFVGVLFSADYELPYPYTPPFDLHTERGYWCAYCYELLAMPIACFSNCALDMIQCYMLMQVSLYFKIICGRLERMGGSRVERGASNGFCEQKFYADFVGVVRLHVRTRDLLKQCEKCVSFPLFIQILSSSFILGFSAYRLQKVVFLENSRQILTLLPAVYIMILQIFLPCFYGNEIIKHSSDLNNAIYNSNWVQCSPKMRKYLVIYMEMLQRSVCVRAGNFFNISLAVFTKTMNNTYTLLTLLWSMNK